jgi:hypothetical protein
MGVIPSNLHQATKFELERQLKVETRKRRRG